MGVPTITRVGPTCVGRATFSQLFHMGLTELAADSDAGFVGAAVALAQDLPRLAELRQWLRARLEQSPLMDAGRFAQNIESVYREIWKDHVQGRTAAVAR
jgi:protein O-GlcNAc transferase